MSVEQRLAARGLSLPPPPVMPAHVQIAFDWVRVVGNRAMVSGHGALDDEGRPAGPFGRVPDEVSLEQAQASACSAILAALASLRTALGDLGRVEAWLSIHGFVNAAPGFAATTAVLNPLSDLVVDLFGPAGRHARTAIGVCALPLNLPVVVSAEVQVTGQAGEGRRPA